MRVLGDGTQRVGVNIQSGAVGEMEHPNGLTALRVKISLRVIFKRLAPMVKPSTCFWRRNSAGKRAAARGFFCAASKEAQKWPSNRRHFWRPENNAA